MSESTEIANAIYHLASTIKGAVAMMGFIALALWVATVLLREKPKHVGRSHPFDPIHSGADECECGLVKAAPIHQR